MVQADLVHDTGLLRRPVARHHVRADAHNSGPHNERDNN